MLSLRIVCIAKREHAGIDEQPAIAIFRKPGQPAWPPAWSYHSTGIATWDRVGPVHEYCDPSTAEDLIRGGVVPVRIAAAEHQERIRIVRAQPALEDQARGVGIDVLGADSPGLAQRVWLGILTAWLVLICARPLLDGAATEEGPA